MRNAEYATRLQAKKKEDFILLTSGMKALMI
jgi:hypothetical protein